MLAAVAPLMKAVLKIVGDFINQVIWFVGCATIADHAFDRWPLALEVSIVMGTVVFGALVWNFWKNRGLLFREGQEEK